MNTPYTVNQYNPDITECHGNGKHAMKGECIYVASVPCTHRGQEPNYACKKWFSKGVLKQQAVTEGKSDPNADTRID